MTTDKTRAAKRVLYALGDIDDIFLEEGEVLDISYMVAARKRKMKMSALAAASIAVAYYFLRPKKQTNVLGKVLGRIA